MTLRVRGSSTGGVPIETVTVAWLLTPTPSVAVNLNVAVAGPPNPVVSVINTLPLGAGAPTVNRPAAQGPGGVVRLQVIEPPTIANPVTGVASPSVAPRVIVFDRPVAKL